MHEINAKHLGMHKSMQHALIACFITCLGLCEPIAWGIMCTQFKTPKTHNPIYPRGTTSRESNVRYATTYYAKYHI